MWIPLAAAWLLTASKEEIEFYRNFIGPPKPAIHQQIGNAEKRPDDGKTNTTDR